MLFNALISGYPEAGVTLYIENDKTKFDTSALVEWLKYPTLVLECPGSIPSRVKNSSRILNGCHDYSTHDMPDL